MKSARVALSLVVTLAALASTPVCGVETVSVGGSGGMGWLRASESTRFVSVARDSVWMWDVRPNGNLMRGLADRGGLSLSQSLPLGEGTPVPIDAGALYDGDEMTAFDPDSLLSVARTNSLIFDLGGSFRVNRIRFFPRLDTANRRRFLQEFSIATSGGEGFNPRGLAEVLEVLPNIEDSFRTALSFLSSVPNAEPVLDRRFSSRDVRFIRLTPSVNREWEIAELQVFGDGTVPIGEFVSIPLRANHFTAAWGQVRFEGGDISEAPVVVQTRIGPDPDPLLYFMLGKADLVKVRRTDWEGATEGLKGPVLPNPTWSGWATVTDGAVRSIGLSRYLQFRVLMSTPGAILRELVFEYAFPPLAQDLAAEIQPLVVEGGEQTEFTLSIQVNLKTTGLQSRRDTGFRQIQVLTDAQIDKVTSVWLDDQPTFVSTSYRPGEGFNVRLFRRVVQNGTFIQIFFTGAVFRDRTRFEVRAVDLRSTETGREEAYQLAREADVDLESAGGALVVQLAGEGEKGISVLAAAKPVSPLFTPNGDGVNDTFELNYTLLKLFTPVPVLLVIHRLDGYPVRTLEAAQGSGHHRQSWDGRDAAGELAPPGLYLYELRVVTDRGTERRHGTVGVVY